MPSHTRYLELADQQLPSWQSQCPPVLHEARLAARQIVAQQGFPTKRHERYKYCSAEEALAARFELSPAQTVAASAQLVADFARQSPVPCSAQALLLADADLRLADALPAGVEICLLSQLPQERAAEVYHQLSRREMPTQLKPVPHGEHDSLTALNTLLLRDALYVRIGANVRLEEPLRIALWRQSEQASQWHQRLIVQAEADSQAQLLLEERNESSATTLSTCVIEVNLAERAQLQILSTEHSHAQHRRFVNLYVEQQGESRFSHVAFPLSTGLSRTQVSARLLGEKAHCENVGIGLTKDKSLVENNLVVDHAVPECTSDMLYKYIAHDESLATFAGKVMVRPDAQHTYSQQTNNNLLLSPTARVRSLPMLEIYADDVRCNHGSTVGSLDETALLYLRQRGIPLAEARLLLQQAFVSEVLDRVEGEALSAHFGALIADHFAQ